MHNGHARALALGLGPMVALFVGVLAVSLGAHRGTALRTLEEPEPASTEDDESFYPGMIDNGTVAISRSLELFPVGHNPHGAIARLVSLYTWEEWADGPGPTPPPYLMNWVDFAPAAPVWMVAILGDDLVETDVVGAPLGPGAPITERSAQGAVYAWDAGSGLPWGVAALSATHRSGGDYASIAALPNELIPIVQATDIPTPDPLVGPPTPSSEP